MTARNHIEEALTKMSQGDIFIASMFYREKFHDVISEAAYYKVLERMVKAKKLGKVAKGVYYIPEVTRFGVVPASGKKITSSLIEDNSGMEVGYSLYRKYGISTQVSKFTHIYSNRIDSNSKTIGNVKVDKIELDFTNDTQVLIAGLEVMQHYYDIQDLNISGFKALAKKFAKSFNQDTFDTILEKIKYKKSTLAFACSILNYYKVSHGISERLSSLSKYHFPEIELLL